AVNTPATMQSEIANGENPALTSFVGASAAPSHTPAANPQITPSPCSESRLFSMLRTAVAMQAPLPPGLMQHVKEHDARDQYEERHQKVAVGQNGFGLLSKGLQGRVLTNRRI